MNYGLEQVEESVIINATVERDIESIVLAFPVANILQISSSREEVSISVERDCHDSVSAVESFFDTISMVDIDIDIEYTVMVLEQLQYC